MAEVIDNPERQRFEMSIDGRTAFVSYRRAPGVVTLTHAEVPAELEGRGIGGELVAATLDALRREGVKVIPRCSFVAAYMRRHTAEYDDLLASG
jgi:uncharacterized protein